MSRVQDTKLRKCCSLLRGCSECHSDLGAVFWQSMRRTPPADRLLQDVSGLDADGDLKARWEAVRDGFLEPGSGQIVPLDGRASVAVEKVSRER